MRLTANIMTYIIIYGIHVRLLVLKLNFSIKVVIIQFGITAKVALFYGAEITVAAV